MNGSVFSCLAALLLVHRTGTAWTAWLNRHMDWLRGLRDHIRRRDERLIVGPDYGLSCRNDQQADNYCRDYSIRFEDPQISVWFDRDNIGGDGDFEIKSLLPGTSWRDGKFVAWNINGELFGRVDRKLHVGAGYGLACVNSQQSAGINCRNYEVRYFC